MEHFHSRLNFGNSIGIGSLNSERREPRLLDKAGFYNGQEAGSHRVPAGSFQQSTQFVFSKTLSLQTWIFYTQGWTTIKWSRWLSLGAHTRVTEVQAHTNKQRQHLFSTLFSQRCHKGVTKCKHSCSYKRPTNPKMTKQSYVQFPLRSTFNSGI